MRLDGRCFVGSSLLVDVRVELCGQCLCIQSIWHNRKTLFISIFVLLIVELPICAFLAPDVLSIFIVILGIVFTLLFVFGRDWVAVGTDLNSLGLLVQVI